MKSQEFRNWLHNLWIENCDEHIEYKMPILSIEEYFAKYKWWLRREYRYQQSRNK